MTDSLDAVVRFVDSGEPVEDGAIGYGVRWREGVVEGLRRKGNDLYTEDPDGIHRGGMYPGGAMQPRRIVFASWEKACEARDAAQNRLDEIIYGFQQTLRTHYARKREESNMNLSGPR